MSDVSFPIAFVAGVISFFAPCAVSLLPAYIGYIAGVSFKELDKGISRYRVKLILSSIFYILGFSLIFVILGTTVAGIGQILRQYDNIIRIIGGVLILVFGLHIAGFLSTPLLDREHKIRLSSWTDHLGYFRAFLVGIVFAMAWTPCVGAILGSILTLAAVSQTAMTGAMLLFIYSLGISIPFIIVSLTLVYAPKYLSFISRYVGTFSRITGLVLAFLGLLLLTNTYRFVNGWLFEIAYRFGYQVK